MLREAVPGIVHIIQGDVMTFDMENLFSEDKKRAWEDHYPPIHIIGNLPFSVSTPLIIKWLRAISEKSAFKRLIYFNFFQYRKNYILVI